jgi:glucosamine-phosphate N-acetyltransferase
MKPYQRSNLDPSPLDVAAATPNTRGIMSTEPPEMTIRLMNATDLKRGFLAALSALKPTNLTDEQAVEIFRRRMRSRVQTYVALIDDRVAGTASLLIEPKFIHNGGTVGHIEDVAVHQAFQHHGIGAALVKHLLDVCRQCDCYKVILDCEDDVIPFYEKLGFHQWERAMRIDL